MMPLDLSRLRINALFGSQGIPTMMDDPAHGGLAGNMSPAQSPIPPVDSSIMGDPAQAQPDINVPDTSVQPDAINPVFQAESKPVPPIVKYYSPQTELEDRLRTALGLQPQRTDYPEAGKYTKVMAHLSALRAKDPIEARRIIDVRENEPYYRDEGDWRNKIDTLMKGANLERQQNVNERLFASAAGRQELNLSDQEIKRMRADAYVKSKEWDMTKPNYRPIISKGGNVILYDQNSGDTQDTGIPSGLLTDEEKIKLNQGARLSEIFASGAEARKTKQTLGAGTTKQPGTAESETQKKAGYLNKAKQAVSEHPEWKDYIQFDPSGGTFTILNPGGWRQSTIDKNKATHDQIYNYIYGNQGAQSSAAPTTQEVKPGYIRVKRKADGQSGQIKQSDFDPKVYDRIP